MEGGLLAVFHMGKRFPADPKTDRQMTISWIMFLLLAVGVAAIVWYVFRVLLVQTFPPIHAVP